jgi:hypothetical protein
MHLPLLDENIYIDSKILSLYYLINLIKYSMMFIILLMSLSSDILIHFIKTNHIFFSLTIVTFIMIIIYLSISINVIRNMNHSILFFLETISLLILFIDFSLFFETYMIAIFCINIVIFSFLMLVTIFYNFSRINKYIFTNAVLIILFCGFSLLMYFYHFLNIDILITILSSFIIINLSLHNIDTIVRNDHHCLSISNDDYLLLSSIFILDIINIPFRILLNMNNIQ